MGFAPLGPNIIKFKVLFRNNTHKPPMETCEKVYLLLFLFIFTMHLRNVILKCVHVYGKMYTSTSYSESSLTISFSVINNVPLKLYFFVSRL